MKNPALFAAFALLLLSACGQKGPLFLPGNPGEVRTDIPSVPAADDEDQDEEQQEP